MKLIKKNYIRNVILIMSGGQGTRFGANCPKQYCIMNKRLVIDYVVDACRNSKESDEIVIVAADNYVEFIQERYGLPVVCGGKTRPESVANGIRYVNEHYNCQKIIITNAVCPLATSEQYDKYFSLLDTYDYVLTAWKLAPALHRFDGIRIDRDDYFNVMEPDAYRFTLLYKNFNFDQPLKYIFHNMPFGSKAYYCFDYPYTMKLTYPHDLKIMEVMYNDIVAKPQRENTIQIVSRYLSSDGHPGIGKWISMVQDYMQEMAQKYSVTSYTINGQTEANIVYEAESETLGSLIFKFTPSKFHFNKEITYYKYADAKLVPQLRGYDENYCALVLEKINPGIQVKFDANNPILRDFYDSVYKTLIPIEKLDKVVDSIPTIMSEFDEYARIANKYKFQYQFRKMMERKAKKIWEKYFENSPKYFLHRDLHRRNILVSKESYIAIDPRGAVGPKEFEFVIPFIIELREKREQTVKLYKEMFAYFCKYCDPERLTAALFIFWVYKMNDYTFQKNDNYQLATWCKESIIQLYFQDPTKMMDKEYMPEQLLKFKS